MINKNLVVVTKQLRYPPLDNKLCWNFATRGLATLGQVDTGDNDIMIMIMTL